MPLNKKQERKRKNQRRKRTVRRRRAALLLVSCSALLVLGSYGFWSASEAVQADSGKAVSAEKKNFCILTKTKDAKAEKIFRENQELLILANKENALPEDYQPYLRTICKGRLEAAEVLYEDLTKMLADAGEEGYHFYIASAYRSREYQQKLIENDVRKLRQRGISYEEALAETYRQVMPAGYSEHETGLALDILASGNSNLDITQEVCPENQWLRAHCMEYGFILRYPKGKEECTGIDYEPWHFRYVGKEAAVYLTENNLTLEEFWDLAGLENASDF